MAKRFLDVTLAVFGLLLSFPALILVALAVKLTSRGPVFFSQERVGQGEKPFNVLKFRTMVHHAEANTGPVWAKADDPRITFIGHFLRRTRLDELPQMFNVLRNEMSFVGPRPERQIFVDALRKQIPYYGERHLVKPGITGWAQIRYPYGASKDDALQKLQFDLYYIKNMSVRFDILILFETVKTVLFRIGSR